MPLTPVLVWDWILKFGLLVTRLQRQVLQVRQRCRTNRLSIAPTVRHPHSLSVPHRTQHLIYFKANKCHIIATLTESDRV